VEGRAKKASPESEATRIGLWNRTGHTHPKHEQKKVMQVGQENPKEGKKTREQVKEKGKNKPKKPREIRNGAKE